MPLRVHGIGEHVKLSVLRPISPVVSEMLYYEYEREQIESAPVYMSLADGKKNRDRPLWPDRLGGHYNIRDL